MRWLFGRVLQALVTAAMALLLFFCIMRLVPGDPVSLLAEDRMLTREQIEAIRKRYSPDTPLPTQLAAYAVGAARGDFGTSILYGRPVRDLVLERLPATLLLGGTVLLLNFTLGIWLGVRQAITHGRATDHLLSTLSLTGYAMPAFWLGLLLAAVFGIWLGWFPVGGKNDPLLLDPPLVTRVLDVLHHLVLPSVTLAMVSIAGTMRYQRTAMLEALAEPYVQAARARGLTERSVRWRHAWRNALFPVLTLFGLWLPILVVGAVFVEAVFAWPGLGGLTAMAANARDYPLLMGTAVLGTAAVVTGSLITDLAHAALDPRLRRS